jgi:hypothetical protein
MNFYKFLVLVFIISIQSCVGQEIKINGVSFVASRDPIDESHVDPVVSINANYAAIMPFGFIKNLDHPEIVFNTDRQWFGETISGAKQYIQTLRDRRIKIMLKPQIWVWRGEFTGYIHMSNEEDWLVLEKSYTAFIMKNATLAQEVDAEIFCIGTELEKFVTARPEYWNTLISEVKSVYKGKLTYAANWDEFKRTPFWSELDYIGVDAYFPISGSKTPSVVECLEGWKSHKETIKGLFQKHNKKVLFTEFGYRSVDYAGKEPWKSDRSMTTVNLEAQSNTTQALFESFWDEEWFAGGFLWKWFHNYDSVGGESNTQFTPQNKPVENVIRNQFIKNNE